MPSTELRQTVLTQAKRLVIKIGSQLLTRADGGIDQAFMDSLAAQVGRLIENGYEITLVSSGAIAVGRLDLNMTVRPKDIGALLAVAAVGQSGLIRRWEQAFATVSFGVGQMLVTRGDFEDRNRYLNFRNCVAELHRIGIVPIVNENDAVSVEEIRLGDNDVLAAIVTNALRADALVLLTVVDGLHDGDGALVDLVDDVVAARALVGGDRSAMGTGGMGTKLEAARAVTDAGEIAVIASGRADDVLGRIAAGEKVGTVFVPAARKLDARRRWIGQTVRPAGVIVVDDGAAAALCDRGKSLLATGITEVTGAFGKGDVVVVRDGRGREIARGLINYHADDTRTIAGQHSDSFESLLGHAAYDEVIHRDNLVITADSPPRHGEDSA